MSIFSKNPKTKLRRNTFNLSHDWKSSLNMGQLVPFICEEMIPGDKFHCKPNIMLRFAPLIAPVMHRVNVYCHMFFVPNRLIWSNWEDFITGGKDGDDSRVPPRLTFNGQDFNLGDLPDYLGIPHDSDYVGSGSSINNTVSALPFAAYQMIYNEYYRDQNLIPEVPYQLTDGNNAALKTSLTTLRYRAWQHDYFTSSLPWTQRGPEATVPLGTSADIIYDETLFPAASSTLRKHQDGSLINPALSPNADGLGFGGSSNIIANDSNLGPGISLDVDISKQHYVDLSTATASTITELRRAFKLQEWLEKSARGGSRYTEHVQEFFGITPEDARLQRPEYIGGFSSPVKISEVLQTAQQFDSSGDPLGTPTGNMSGHGISVGSGKYSSYFAKEHGWFIGIMSVRPTTAYQQGTHRKFNRLTRFDYYWPQFAHIGEQAVESKEIVHDRAGNNGDTFGYIPRYSEYKYVNSHVHGDFKTLNDFWHMGRKFSSRPFLNQNFIECVTTNDIDQRIFAVTDGEVAKLWSHVYVELKASRPMPYFGNPKF